MHAPAGEKTRLSPRRALFNKCETNQERKSMWKSIIIENAGNESVMEQYVTKPGAPMQDVEKLKAPAGWRDRQE